MPSLIFPTESTSIFHSIWSIYLLIYGMNVDCECVIQTIEYELEQKQKESLKREQSELESESVPVPIPEQVPSESGVGDDSDSTTLYIKNLNWKTEEEGIRKMFGKVDGLKTVVIPKKKGPGGENLPMGFGFVVYEDRQQALKALNRYVI